MQAISSDRSFSFEPPVISPGEADARVKQLDLLERAVAAGAWRFDTSSGRVTLSVRLANLLELSIDLSLEQWTHAYAPDTRKLMELALEACLNHGQTFDE